MKTTLTITMDADIKAELMPIIQNQGLSLSGIINDYLKKLLIEQREAVPV